MTDETAAGARAQTLPAQRLVNRVVRGLLRTPLLSRAVGKRLITRYVVGRKTGRRYTLPVAYTRQGEALLIGSPFSWIRNLRTGEQVDIRLKGKRSPRTSKSSLTKPVSSTPTPRWPATTTTSPSSTRSAWTPPATRTKPTCTWPGQAGHGPSD